MLSGTPRPGREGLFESPAKTSPPSCVLGCRGLMHFRAVGKALSEGDKSLAEGAK